MACIGSALKWRVIVASRPLVLAWVPVLQFLERFPDRAAAEAAMMRMDWK